MYASEDQFSITAIGPEGQMQGKNQKGEVREFCLCVDATNPLDLRLYAARHYVDPDSLASFSGSAPWGLDELVEA